MNNDESTPNPPAIPKKDRGHPSKWSHAQNERLKQSLPEWHKFGMEANRDLDTSDKIFTLWKKTKAKELLKESVFQDLPENMTYQQAITTIIRKYTNYLNRARQNENGHTNTAAIKAAANSLVDLKTYSKGKTVFKKRKHEQIHARQQKLMETNPTLPRIGAYQSALKQLWAEEEDHDYWEAQAKATADDIFENQEHFEELLYTSLRGICRSGSVGPTEVLIYWAYRLRDDSVLGSCLQVHHSDEVPDYDPMAGVRGGTTDQFADWATTVIPARREHGFGIEITTSGLPVLIDHDWELEGPLHIKQILTKYFTAVWEHSCPDSGQIPWNDIYNNPIAYYDTSSYTFKVPLRHPSKLSVQEIYDLIKQVAQYSTISMPAPFVFALKQPGPEHLNDCLDMALLRFSPESEGNVAERVPALRPELNGGESEHLQSKSDSTSLRPDSVHMGDNVSSSPSLVSRSQPSSDRELPFIGEQELESFESRSTVDVSHEREIYHEGSDSPISLLISPATNSSSTHTDAISDEQMVAIHTHSDGEPSPFASSSPLPTQTALHDPRPTDPIRCDAEHSTTSKAMLDSTPSTTPVVEQADDSTGLVDISGHDSSIESTQSNTERVGERVLAGNNDKLFETANEASPHSQPQMPVKRDKKLEEKKKTRGTPVPNQDNSVRKQRRGLRPKRGQGGGSEIQPAKEGVEEWKRNVVGRVTLTDGRKGVITRDKRFGGGYFTPDGECKALWDDDLDGKIASAEELFGPQPKAKKRRLK